MDGDELESCTDEASTKPKWEQARPHSPQSIAAAPHSSNGFGSELYSFVDRESPASRHDAESGTTLSTTTGTAQKPELAATQGELHGSESETLRQQRDEMDLQALKCGAQTAVPVAASGAGGLLLPSCQNEDVTRAGTCGESCSHTNADVHMLSAEDASPAARHRHKRLPCGLECVRSWKSVIWCIAAIVAAIACSLPLGFVLGRQLMQSNTSLGGASYCESLEVLYEY